MPASTKYPSFNTSFGRLMPSGQDLQQFVQDVIGGGMIIPDAPSDGLTYGRNNGAWIVTTSAVTTVAGKTGNVTLTHNDITDWNVATAGFLTGNQTVTLTGDVTGVGSTTVATTLATVNPNVGTFQGITVNGKGLVTAAANQNYASLNSPTFTGTPTAPTPAPSDNSNAVATTSFVHTAFGGTAVQLGANHIINGDMFVDQRNNGASGTSTLNTWPCDRWFYGVNTGNGTWQRIGGASNPVDAGLIALGFSYCLSYTSTTAHVPSANESNSFVQNIEGDQIADFCFGTANAQPLQLSFYAFASVSGSYSGCLNGGNARRCFPFLFPLVANVWTKIVVSIPGDATGEWDQSGSERLMSLYFSLGSTGTFLGTPGAWSNGFFQGAIGETHINSILGAVFKFTGVKLEVGNTPTPFNIETLDKRISDCQRYYQSCGQYVWQTYTPNAGQNLINTMTFPKMRAPPAVAFLSPAYANASGVTASGITSNSIVIQAVGTAVGDSVINIVGGITLNAEIS